MEEAKHWESLKSGQIDALEALYIRHVEALYSYGIVLCHEPDKVKDCIHDLFVYIWNSRERLTLPESGKAYLMVSLRRRLFDKGPKINELMTDMDTVDKAGIITDSHEQRWIQFENASEMQLKLEGALGQLSPRQREIVYMKYYQQMDYDEIGNIMDLNYQSARNLVTRALIALRKEMSVIVIILFLMT